MSMTNNDLLQIALEFQRIDRTLDSLILNGPERIHRGLVTTTDATPTTISTFATKSNTAYLFQLDVVARRTDVSGSAGYQRIFRVKNVADTVTIGTVTATYTDEDVAGWDVTIAASGVNVLIKVTGAAGQTINWAARYRAESEPPNVGR